jgi:molybdopterin molybdotransferase
VIPESAALTVDEARMRIARAIVPIVAHESVALADALGRVLAADCIAPVDVPPHANAAMDGFALSMTTAATRQARIVGVARAGHPYDTRVAPGECVRIMTGAVVPEGCDVVVPNERVDAATDRIALPDAPVARHIRAAGEDLRRGSVAIARGRRLQPAHLGLVASLGIARLDVMRRPRVAVFSTGDELLAIDEPSRPGALRDSNRHALMGLMKTLDADVVDLGIVPDDPVRLRATIDAACDTHAVDAIVTSGGVSAGDADYTRAAFAQRGDVAFWTLAIKPGRPMAFGTLAGTRGSIPFFGLPGNPVAVMVAFQVFVREALLALAGATPEVRLTMTARCEERIAKQRGRTEYVRGVATRAGDAWSVRTTGDQGSGILRSMSEANCLIVLGHDRGDVAVGDLVEAWPLRGLI